MSRATGEKVRLRDIATIEDTFDRDQPTGYRNGERAIELYVQRTAQADTLKTARRLDEYLTEVLPTLPASLTVTKYEIRADRLVERIMLLVKNGAGGLALVLIILFVFLNARIAFWVAVGIPVAMMATLGFMWASGPEHQHDLVVCADHDARHRG